MCRQREIGRRPSQGLAAALAAHDYPLQLIVPSQKTGRSGDVDPGADQRVGEPEADHEEQPGDDPLEGAVSP